METTAPADTAAAVAAVIDAARHGDAPPSPVDGRDRTGRPPVSPDKLSMHPEAVRARNRRKGPRPAAPVDSRPKFTAALVKAEPAVERPAAPPPPTAPTAEQIQDSTKFLVRAIKLGGTIAAKLLHDDRMLVTDEDANDVARQVIDGYPELAILDGDGKKFLAWFAVISLIVARWGMLQRGRPPAESSGRPPGEPVKVVAAPASSGGMMDPVTL